MAKGFKRKGERYVARLDEAERTVVVGLLSQIRDFVAPPEAAGTGDALEDLVGSWSAPDDLGSLEFRDPALERLLPNANRQDDEAAAEFRRLTERTLRERKVAHLSTAIEALSAVEGDRVALDRGQAQALAIGLTDVRLVLGERLGLRTDEDADLLHRLTSESADPDDPRVLLAAYYDFLTWLQESVTIALMG